MYAPLRDRAEQLLDNPENLDIIKGPLAIFEEIANLPCPPLDHIEILTRLLLADLKHIQKVAPDTTIYKLRMPNHRTLCDHYLTLLRSPPIPFQIPSPHTLTTLPPPPTPLLSLLTPLLTPATHSAPSSSPTSPQSSFRRPYLDTESVLTALHAWREEWINRILILFPVGKDPKHTGGNGAGRASSSQARDGKKGSERIVNELGEQNGVGEMNLKRMSSAYLLALKAVLRIGLDFMPEKEVTMVYNLLVSYFRQGPGQVDVSNLAKRLVVISGNQDKFKEKILKYVKLKDGKKIYKIIEKCEVKVNGSQDKSMEKEKLAVDKDKEKVRESRDKLIKKRPPDTSSEEIITTKPTMQIKKLFNSKMSFSYPESPIASFQPTFYYYETVDMSNQATTTDSTQQSQVTKKPPKGFPFFFKAELKPLSAAEAKAVSTSTAEVAYRTRAVARPCPKWPQDPSSAGWSIINIDGLSLYFFKDSPEAITPDECGVLILFQSASID